MAHPGLRLHNDDGVHSESGPARQHHPRRRRTPIALPRRHLRRPPQSCQTIGPKQPVPPRRLAPRQHDLPQRPCRRRPGLQRRPQTASPSTIWPPASCSSHSPASAPTPTTGRTRSMRHARGLPPGLRLGRRRPRHPPRAHGRVAHRRPRRPHRRHRPVRPGHAPPRSCGWSSARAAGCWPAPALAALAGKSAAGSVDR